jgi:hypothetical protein
VSDRLDELRRQRELARQQLAWLDSEIAAAEGAPRPPEEPAVRPPAPPGPADTRSPEAILEEFRRAPAAVARQTKLGCILYFAGAMALLLLGFAALYLYARATRGR